MSNTLTPAEASLFQKYAPTLLSAAVLVLGGLKVLTDSHFGLVPDLVFAALVITTLTTFQFTGWWKVGLEIAGVLVAVALPFAINGTLTYENGFLIAVAVLKALATQFGVVLRADTTTNPEPVSVTNLTYANLPPAPTSTNYVLNLDSPLGEPQHAAPAPKAGPKPKGSDPVPAPDNEKLPQPAKSATRDKWVAFAEQYGYDDSEKLTKANLALKYGLK